MQKRLPLTGSNGLRILVIPGRHIFLADLGDPRAAYFTATMLRYSPRIAKDEKLAFDYFLKSARAGHPNSQYEIGRYYTNGRGPVQGNYETAAGWYKKAADQNNAEAQNMLSLMYSDGLGKVFMTNDTHACSHDTKLKSVNPLQ